MSVLLAAMLDVLQQASGQEMMDRGLEFQLRWSWSRGAIGGMDHCTQYEGIQSRCLLQHSFFRVPAT